jgi:chromosome segregation protein
MKIKKLSITGFKSFMERLDISFPPGISGVVGPNGCGKSNIVDAIRWCMGEQSPKMLRGRRMEDIIFNGAGDQKPLGMAEVSLILENGDGTFPPAFSDCAELMVTRRLYRSGESDYLINNMPCRLKDIQEIFMDTGLGNKAYSIIGQGQIGTILEQRPEDTRVMLEEAAGITKYRKKVEASQRKIEATEANLQRVEDIIGEVGKQIRSLKYQASKARRYKRISEDIRDLELVLHANKYHRLKEDSGKKLRSTEALVQEESAKSAGLGRFQNRIESMNLELDEKDRQLAEHRAAHLRLRERFHKKEAALDSLAHDMKLQEELQGRLEAEQSDIRKRMEALKKEKGKLVQERETLNASAGHVEGEINLKERRLGSRRESLKALREAYEAARGVLSESSNEEMGLTHESGYLNKMLNQITDSRSRLEKELRDAAGRTENVAQAAQRKQQVREATQERLKEVLAAIADGNAQYQDLEEEKARIESLLKTAEGELNACQSRLATLQTLTENFEGYKVGVRTIMKARDLEPNQQGRILGLVADVIQVAPQYEQAVEAVLADKLQYVIVESQEDGKKAVDYLKTKARGRSSFVPLRDLNGNGNSRRTRPEYTLLRDLVTVPESYGVLMDALLGDTALVEDLVEALDAWRSNGKDLCFVTLDGDMVDERGVVSGGKVTQTSYGLLSRKREIKELRDNLRRHEETVTELQLKLQKTDKALDEKKQAIERLNEDKWARQDEINELDKALFRLGQELDQLDKLALRIKEDLASKDQEKERHQRELERIEGEIKVRQVKLREEESLFRKKERELKESEQEFDQFRDELASLKSDHRIILEEARSLTREMERIDAHADESAERTHKIAEEIALSKQRHEDCQKRRAAGREELEGLYDKLKAAEDMVNGAELDRQAFQAGIREEEDKAEALRAEIQELKERIGTARMEHSEIQFRMNNHVEVIRDKYNLNLVDIHTQHVAEDFSATEVEETLEKKKDLKQRLGEVNLTAIQELEALKERFEFMKTQRDDLIKSIDDLRTAIRKINRTSLEKFHETFLMVDQKLKEIFPILFNGGTAGLRLMDAEKPLDSGVLVEVQPPGKKLSHMGLLSGGEKALVAMALLFAIYMIKPSPFCLLDEVDAPLDEANIDRFNNLIREIRKASQIIMVTHNRRTMEIVDRLYGVTMERAGISTTVSVDLKGRQTEAREIAPPPEEALVL